MGDYVPRIYDLADFNQDPALLEVAIMAKSSVLVANQDVVVKVIELDARAAFI